MVELVQPLQWGEQPEHLAEPLRLELPELQQVERRSDERQRQHGEAQNADGDVQDRPRAAPHRARLRHQTDEQGQPDQSGGERARDHADGGRPKRRLTRHLGQREEQGEHGERRGDAHERREPRHAEHVRRDARQGYTQEQAARCGAQPGKRRQHQQRGHGIQAQGDEMSSEDHELLTPAPRAAGPANQDGIFRMSRTGMPGTRLACSILRISPDAEWSRVCTISTTTCTCSDEVPGNPDAGLNASNTSPGLTPSARPRLMKMICWGPVSTWRSRSAITMPSSPPSTGVGRTWPGSLNGSSGSARWPSWMRPNCITTSASTCRRCGSVTRATPTGTMTLPQPAMSRSTRTISSESPTWYEAFRGAWMAI